MFLLSKHPLVLSLLLITAASPVASAIKAFENRYELEDAVYSYCAGTFNDESTYGSIENWDVSKITDMSHLFTATKPCNPKIGNWDVSKVTDFSYMFASAEAFNQDISNWNVGSGTKFTSMFFENATFNQDISKWNVGSGTNFSFMFYKAATFNQDISKWNVGSGTKFNSMFENAATFNQDISNWNVGSGTNFSYMFETAEAFNQDISNWNVGSGTKFSRMFAVAKAFNQDISNWNVGSGTTFTGIFKDATAFNQPLIYCKWQSNSYFKNTSPKPCNGSVSCGWGLSECPVVCIDSPLQFQVKTEGGSLLPFSCKLAEKDKDKLTCSDQGQVATHCPKVCGKCSEYECSDAEGVFFMRNGKERECSWLKEMTEDKRSEKCKKTNVAQTCRETCKVCE